MTSKHLLTALIAVPALMALEPRADGVRFAPSEGSSLKKTFEIEFNLSLGDLTMLANGMDMSESLPADFEVTASAAMTVVDTYVDLEDEKPLDLIRLYDAVSGQWETPDESGEAEDGQFTELVGKQVRFQWNGDTETYAVSYHEGEGDAESLEGLGIDMDLRSMLPEGEVSEGDTWTLESDEVVRLLFFGAELDKTSFDIEDDGSGFGPLFESEILPQIQELLGGLKAECTYSGQREVDAATMGAIDLKLQGEGTLDLRSAILAMIELQMPDGMEVAVSVDEATVSLALDGAGTLLWDLEGGHLHSFEMAPELELLVDVYVSIDVGGETQDFEASVELLGNGTWSAAAAE